ncbi:MAG: hypothetical protein KatS3mg011_0669 [Acidimicrobiia bacterium]|jgi:hypothetical protein|nr:MAG: hypothetical protein KatS3mg011_0669 [Acidimicrobiia bacterium]
MSRWIQELDLTLAVPVVAVLALSLGMLTAEVRSRFR